MRGIGLLLLSGCVGSVTVNANTSNTTHEAPAASHAEARSESRADASTEDHAGDTRVDYRVRLRVEGNGAGETSPSGGAAGAVVSHQDPDPGGPARCPGVTVDEAGHTRSGRALGMGLLQVYARPGAELLVDETFRGATPLTAVGADAGPRDVRLRNLPLGYDCTFRLRVLPGVRYSILLDVKKPGPSAGPGPVFTER